MKYLKLFETFTLTDLEQQYQDAKDLYELGLIDRTGLRYVEDQLKLERYIADGSNGYLDLYGTGIQSLGELREVGGDLDLRGTPIKSLGELTQVGRYLYLIDTPIAKTHTEREIKAMVRVRGQVLL